MMIVLKQWCFNDKGTMHAMKKNDNRSSLYVRLCTIVTDNSVHEKLCSNAKKLFFI